MSLYALHANALRPLVAKYKGRTFRNSDEVREFADDLINALMAKGPVDLAETLRISYDGSGPAMVLEHKGAWKECPIQFIPEPADCLCDFGCCCDGVISAIEEEEEEEEELPRRVRASISYANGTANITVSGVLDRTEEPDEDGFHHWSSPESNVMIHQVTRDRFSMEVRTSPSPAATVLISNTGLRPAFCIEAGDPDDRFGTTYAIAVEEGA